MPDGVGSSSAEAWRTASGAIPAATEASKRGTGRRSPGTRCPDCPATSSISPKVCHTSFSWKRPVLSFKTKEPEISAVPTIEPATTSTVFHLRRVKFRRPIRRSAGRRAMERMTSRVITSAVPEKKIVGYKPNRLRNTSSAKPATPFVLQGPHILQRERRARGNRFTTPRERRKAPRIDQGLTEPRYGPRPTPRGLAPPTGVEGYPRVPHRRSHLHRRLQTRRGSDPWMEP